MNAKKMETRSSRTGGRRAAPVAGRRNGGSGAEERMEVTVRVRPKRVLTESPEWRALQEAPVTNRRHLSREEFAARFGADPEDLAQVEAFAHRHGLATVDCHAGRRAVRLAGTRAAMQQAFGVTLQTVRRDGGHFRHCPGPARIPEALAPLIEGVFGLDSRPVVRPHFRFVPFPGGVRPRVAPGARPFTPVEVAQLYDFPANLDGTGQCIGLLEFGGGYQAADLQNYFSGLGLAPAPQVSAVAVDGRHNAPTGDPQGPDGEVMLDIEVAGAVAPGARIAVYFAPNAEDGFLDALRTAIHDPVRRPSVISLSWGGPESGWSPPSLRDFDTACQEAAALGVTVCCAAGDNGAGDTPAPSSAAEVDFPASSPHVLACGGTRLVADAGGIVSEVVWNSGGGWATGGGVSAVFPPPGWQANAGVPPSVNPGASRGRGVPDVAGDADSATGYVIRVDGAEGAAGGTSAVAPLWAGLIARFNQGLGKPAGFLNPLIYRPPASTNGFRDIVTGNNGAFSGDTRKYTAGPGWDACTGWGSPKGAALWQALRA